VPEFPRPLTLLTFSPMVDSECTRLLLAYYGKTYAEQDRLFGWVSILTLLRGGYGRVPFVSGDGRMSQPRDIVKRYDGKTGRPPLLPADPEALKAVEGEWTRWNWDYGFDTAKLAYFHLLPQRTAMIESFGKPITATGRAALPYTYGALALLFRVALQLSEANAAAAWTRIRKTLDALDATLADGRPFIGGTAMTLADIGFASSSAPVMLPPHYAPRIPTVDQLPIILRDMIAECRARPCAALVARVYSACLQENRS
jgi:glutathione S-transferase